MKNKFTFCLTLLIASLTSYSAQSQTICNATADTVDGVDYIVYWEQPSNITNIDSAIIYKDVMLSGTFVRVGAVKVGATDPTHFRDYNSNTLLITRYAVAFKDLSNVEGPRSLWHQPVVLDYDPAGLGVWNWTPYQIENQVSSAYIVEYRCMIDLLANGNFTLLGTVSNTQLAWTDANWASHTASYYVMETVLPTCNFIEKANINTSRSNIKQQFTNAEAGISESSLKGVKFDILSNPVSDNLEIIFNEELNNATIWISATNGTQLENAKVTGTEYKSSISHLSQGIYFVNVEVNGVVTTKRFIKK